MEIEIRLKELSVKWGGRSKSSSTQGAVRWHWVVLGGLLLCGIGLYSKGLIHFGRVGVAASPSEGGTWLEGQVQWKAEYQGTPGSQTRGR
jgi:hypothetical protein